MKTLLIYMFWIIVAFFYSCNNHINSVNTIENKSIVKSKLLTKANDYYNNNNYNEAIKFFDLLIKLDTTLGEAYFKRGYCRALLHDMPNSTNDYLNAIKFDYRVDEAYFSIGLNYSEKMDYKNALIYFNKAFEKNPNNKNAQDYIEITQKIIRLLHL